MSTVRIDQAPIQIIQGNDADLQIDQAAVQVVQGGNAKIRIDQAIIQVICSPPSGSFWPVLLRMIDQQRSGA